MTWQVFEASAMVELHWNKELKIATNVFEFGMKRFSDEVGFVVRYLDFLITINDDGSKWIKSVLVCISTATGLTIAYTVDARAVFERAIAKISPESAKPLWTRWAEYEYLFGDLSAIQRLDARLAEVYPGGASWFLSTLRVQKPQLTCLC